MGQSAPEKRPLTRVVIVGGGTAGWMAAAAMAHRLKDSVHITLIESPDIPIIGVGEATIPHMREFITALGIDEAGFMAAVDATYKLGINFENFGKLGNSYIHPFGSFGRPLNGVPFHHFWLRAASEGHGMPFHDYSLPIRAAKLQRFAQPTGHPSQLEGSYGYAYHFDATRLAPYLRDFAMARGVQRIEGTVTHVDREAEAGNVAALMLSSGQTITGELFVDCSGFRSLLLGQTLAEPWEDWSPWLICDRAAALPCKPAGTGIEPYTRAIGMAAGWRWRIPLRGRVGNGYVFSSHHLSDDEACSTMLNLVENDPLADPRIVKFTAGRRKKSWVRNVVGIGLSSGFLEPLESTSIYLTQIAIACLIELFPNDKSQDPDSTEFNRLMDIEYGRIRDFLILHYHATQRSDSAFWDDMRHMAIPDSLSDALELWRKTGRIAPHAAGLFHEPSWIAVLLGQNIVPESYDPRAAIPSLSSLNHALHNLHQETERLAQMMPDHAASFHAQGDAHAS